MAGSRVPFPLQEVARCALSHVFDRCARGNVRGHFGDVIPPRRPRGLHIERQGVGNIIDLLCTDVGDPVGRAASERRERQSERSAEGTERAGFPDLTPIDICPSTSINLNLLHHEIEEHLHGGAHADRADHHEDNPGDE